MTAYRACSFSYYNICPDTDPSLIGIDEVYTTIAASGQVWATCSPYMNAYNCTTELNFTNVADGPFYIPHDLPPNGTATLSNIDGTLPAPPSGALFSYTNYYDSTVYTITAAVDGLSAAVASGTDGSPASGPFSSGGVAVPTMTINAGAAVQASGQSHGKFGVVAAVAGVAILL